MRNFSIDIIWAKIQMAVAAIGGWLGYFLGGMDGLMIALIVFMVLDYITGLMCAEAIPLTDRIYCGVCGKRYRYKVTRLGTPYAAPVWICSTFNYRGKAYCASKQIPEDILKELITSVLGTVHTEDSVHHIEMHPGNRVLFVFQDGHTEEHFCNRKSRCHLIKRDNP